MIKLKTLKFKNIGRFIEEQTIDFASLGHLVQFDAMNTNTGGSSGSGKSTIFHALEYLLGINDLPTTILQSRLTKEGIWVYGEFDWDGMPVTITRSKTDGLIINENGEIKNESSKLAEERLDRILGIPRPLLRPLLHKRQKEGGFFLALTPDKMNKFLIEALGLSHLRSKLGIVDEKLTLLEEKKKTTSVNLAANASGLKATQDAITSLGLPPVKEIHKKTILSLKDKMDASVVVLEALKTKHRIESEALEVHRPKFNAIPYDRTQITSLEVDKTNTDSQIESLKRKERDRQLLVSKELSRLKLARSQLESTIDRGKQATSMAAEVAKEIKSIRASVCPTCEQDWTAESAKIKEAKLLEKIRDLKLSIDASNEANKNIGAVNFSIAEAEQNMGYEEPEGLEDLTDKLIEISTRLNAERKLEEEHSVKQYAQQKKIIEGFTIKEKTLRDSQSTELELTRGQVDVDVKIFQAAVMKLKSYEEAKIRYETSLVSLNEQESSYKQKVDNLIQELSAVESELLVAEEVKRALKSYISCSFDDALAYISDTSTRIIRNIPNMANATIQLEGIRETKEGKIREEVNAVINMDGEVNIPIKSISGGERSSIDLTVDLAVIELIESRVNRGIDILVLDEPFEGLDTICIEQVLEVLKNVSLTKRLIIVDHNPEVKEMVEDRVIIVREGATSKIAA